MDRENLNLHTFLSGQKVEVVYDIFIEIATQFPLTT